MLGKHSLSTANAYDTEALEDALEGACGGNIKITQRLELRRLATSLWYDTEMNKQGTIQQNHNEPLKALTNIKAWVPGDALKDEMQSLQDRQKKIEEDLSAVPPPAPRLHPNLASIYKEKIANLVQALTDPSTLIEANTAIRRLIERVQLVPENGELKIELYGELAALLKLGTEPKTNTPKPKARGCK